MKCNKTYFWIFVFSKNIETIFAARSFDQAKIAYFWSVCLLFPAKSRLHKFFFLFPPFHSFHMSFYLLLVDLFYCKAVAKAQKKKNGPLVFHTTLWYIYGSTQVKYWYLISGISQKMVEIKSQHLNWGGQHKSTFQVNQYVSYFFSSKGQQ